MTNVYNFYYNNKQFEFKCVKCIFFFALHIYIREYFCSRLYAWKSYQTQTFPQQNSTEESLQINENMRLHPVGFVALFTKSWIIIFYRQRE